MPLRVHDGRVIEKPVSDGSANGETEKVTMNAVPVAFESTPTLVGASAGPMGMIVTGSDSAPTQEVPYARTAKVTGMPTGKTSVDSDVKVVCARS